MALKNQNIAKANPSSIANRAFIDALYKERYGRYATNAEYEKFKNSTVKDASNIILGQKDSPFVNVPSAPTTPTKTTDNKQGITIPTTSKINDKTGEIINPTKKDVEEYNKNYETIKMISKDEIKKAFQAYGYTPNDADLQYWSLKPNTDLTNMHEKLQARKDKEESSRIEQEKIKVEQQKTQNEQIKSNASGNITWEDEKNGALVKLATDPDGSGPLNSSTVFWVNNQTKKIIPIISESAFQSFYGMPVSNAKINTITVDYLGDDGALGKNSGYSLVPLSQGINGTKSDDAYKINPETVNEGNLGIRYGEKALSTEQLTKVLLGVDGFFDQINKDTNFGISSDLINQIKNDQNQVAFYMNALAYGGYTLADIARDLKRKQLIKDGDNSLASTTVISDTKKANDYYNTTEGSAAKTNPLIAPPKYLGSIDMNLLNYPIFDLPADLYNTLVPPFDPYSEEGKSEMEKVQTAFYDIIQKQLNASTERGKLLADENYKQFQKDVKEKYGIYLSNNATTAWNQLGTVLNNVSAAGISGSGMESEAVNKQLQETRKKDMLTRKTQQSEEESARAEQLQKYGNAAEIAALSDADKIKYGFKPSTETANFFSAENLRKLYPTLSDDQIKIYQNSILDENGNYRSDLYQTLYQNTYGTKAGLSVPTGGVQPAKSAYQQQKVVESKALEEEKKYAPYTAGEAFSKPLDTTTTTQPGASSSGAVGATKETTPLPSYTNPPVATNFNQPTQKVKIQNTLTGGIFETTPDDFEKSYDKKYWKLA